MKFWKMNGTGNDFLIIDNSLLKIKQKDLPFLAKTLCERHHSIGADGLMIVENESEGKILNCSYIELGNPGIPHLVVEIQNLKSFDEDKLYRVGAYLRSHKNYPKGANVNFYEKLEEGHYYERTFERGVEGFTLACGTGTGSLVSILTLKGESNGKDIKVDMQGGRLIVNAESKDGKIENLYLRGATNVVCKGEVTDENIKDLVSTCEI